MVVYIGGILKNSSHTLFSLSYLIDCGSKFNPKFVRGQKCFRYSNNTRLIGIVVTSAGRSSSFFISITRRYSDWIDVSLRFTATSCGAGTYKSLFSLCAKHITRHYSVWETFEALGGVGEDLHILIYMKATAIFYDEFKWVGTVVEPQRGSLWSDRPAPCGLRMPELYIFMTITMGKSFYRCRYCNNVSLSCYCKRYMLITFRGNNNLFTI